MASSIGGDFAQAYVMSKHHKEKMEKVMQQEMGNKATMKEEEIESNKGGGFFGLMRKKVHPNGAKSDDAGAPAAGK